MTDDPTDTHEGHPWDAQPDESSKAHAALEAYLEMGRARSLTKLAEDDRIDHSLRWLKEWSRRHDWQRRSRAWDAHMHRVRQAEREEKHREEMDQFAERQRQLNMAALQASIRTLQHANRLIDRLEDGDLKPRDIPNLLRAAAKVSEAASSAQATLLGVDEVLMYLEDLEAEDPLAAPDEPPLPPAASDESL